MSLCSHVLTGSEEQRDICSIGLKTVVLEMPPTMANSAIRQLTPQLISGVQRDSLEVKLECLEVLNDLLRRFAASLAEAESRECLNALFGGVQACRAVAPSVSAPPRPPLPSTVWQGLFACQSPLPHHSPSPAPWLAFHGRASLLHTCRFPAFPAALTSRALLLRTHLAQSLPQFVLQRANVPSHALRRCQRLFRTACSKASASATSSTS